MRKLLLSSLFALSVFTTTGCKEPDPYAYETHIENMVHAGSASQHSFDELMAHYDQALLLFEQLQQPEAYAAAMAEVQAAAAAPYGAAHAESERPIDAISLDH